MHSWYDDKDPVDWNGINEAARYIAEWLRKWARMGVRDYKEKWGTVRVYCSFGFDCFHAVVYPGYCWIHKWWPYKLDLWISYHTPILKWINRIVIPIQQKLYIWRYTRAVQKWPHLYNEIVSCADYGKLFDGKLPGYKHSTYWREIE